MTEAEYVLVHDLATLRTIKEASRFLNAGGSSLIPEPELDQWQATLRRWINAMERHLDREGAIDTSEG